MLHLCCNPRNDPAEDGRKHQDQQGQHQLDQQHMDRSRDRNGSVSKPDQYRRDHDDQLVQQAHGVDAGEPDQQNH